MHTEIYYNFLFIQYSDDWFHLQLILSDVMIVSDQVEIALSYFPLPVSIYVSKNSSFIKHLLGKRKYH